MKLSEDNKLRIIQEQAEKCTECNLHSTRNKCVFSKGSENSKIMFVCEAPGKQEDEQGIPLVGRSGKNLDKILHSLNINDNIYFCNVLKCRPPENRKPSKLEIESCKKYLFAQISLINPIIIIAAGSTAVEAILQNKQPISEIRGIKKSFFLPGEDKERFVIPTYHPSYMLYNRSSTDIVKSDILRAIEFLGK